MLNLKRESDDIIYNLTAKRDLISNQYFEIMRNNSYKDITFGLDSLTFQRMIINKNYDHLTDSIKIITNRIYGDYFRLYNKLSGMTGTADTEAAELKDIYNLEVIIIPPNKPSMRDDCGDQIYMTIVEKLNAIAKEVKEYQTREQPVLIGTSSIDTSEVLSKMLTQHKIKHNVLNAKQHEREAEMADQT